MIGKINIVLIAVMLSLVITAGCYAETTATVVDVETGKPIEGAVVLVEWTKTKGVPGMSHTESAKVIEVVSDKDGKVVISGNIDPLVDPPNITIYRKGYVAWHSRWIFPSWENRKDFQWRSGNVYGLEKFKDTYSYTDHQLFVSRAINDTIGWESKKTFIRMYDEAEKDKIIKEQNTKDLDRMRSPR
jgi:hypothetical protein